MLFNSVQFVLFLPVCVMIYYILPGKIRNRYLLLISYFFYMCWNPKYILLLFFSTIVTWLCGFGVETAQNETLRKAALAGTVLANLLILFIFKYYNFFWDLITALLNRMNITVAVRHSTLLLPVGISFYIFQALGYSIDVYRKDIKHERNLFDYALFVSFFPQLVAGPIERSKNLLPQFKTVHCFNIDKTVDAMRLILWGMFKKIVVADMAALYVDAVFAGIQDCSGLTVLAAIFLFTMQIYGDFAGYSDVARGTAMIFGFDLMKNFSAPYFSSSVKEFWQRWHISLSTWLRDYIYVPLGGNRKGFVRKCINIFIVFSVSGLWHGANMTFCLWGGVHGICRIIEECVSRILGEYKFNIGFNRKLFKILTTLLCFLLIQFAWIFFRAETLDKAFLAIHQLFTGVDVFAFFEESKNMISAFMPDYFWIKWMYIIILTVAIIFIGIFDFLEKYVKVEFLIAISKCGMVSRWLLYYLMILTVMFCFVMTTNEYGQAGAFLYFQF